MNIPANAGWSNLGYEGKKVCIFSRPLPFDLDQGRLSTQRTQGDLLFLVRFVEWTNLTNHQSLSGQTI